MNDYQFGNFIYTLRTEKGLSQSQLGEMLGVTNKAVSKWENGSAKPNTKLLPQIASILGVTVEELFAARRIEKASELDQLKQYLIMQKKKYAILASVFLAVMVILPVILVEFISIIMGFHLPDDVIGPLGSVTIIILFIIALTAYIIFRNSFKNLTISSEYVCCDNFFQRIFIGHRISVLSFCISFVALVILFDLILYFEISGFLWVGLLCFMLFLFTTFLGLLVCYTSIRRLLKLRRLKSSKSEPMNLSQMPAWFKVCYFSTSVLFAISVCMGIGAGGSVTTLIIKSTVLVGWVVCLFAVILYRKKKG